jgi:hypothetical protein
MFVRAITDNISAVDTCDGRGTCLCVAWRTPHEREPAMGLQLVPLSQRLPVEAICVRCNLLCNSSKPIPRSAQSCPAPDEVLADLALAVITRPSWPKLRIDQPLGGQEASWLAPQSRTGEAIQGCSVIARSRARPSIRRWRRTGSRISGGSERNWCLWRSWNRLGHLGGSWLRRRI